MLLLISISAPASGGDWRALLEEASSLRDADPAAALVLLEQSLPTDEVSVDPANDPSALANLYRLRGELLRGAGQYDQAVKDAERFAALALLTDEPGLAARALFLHGSIEAEQGHLAQALELFHEARGLLAGTELPAEMARILNAIGVTHNFSGDGQRAAHYFERAVEQAQLAGDEFLSVNFLGNLAAAIGAKKGPDAALPIQREVRERVKNLENASLLALAEANLCDLLVQAGQYDEAEVLCPDTIEVVDRHGELRWQVGMRMAMGDLRRAQDRFEEALHWYEEGLALAGQRAPTVQAELLERLADLNEALGRSDQALAALRTLISQRQALREDDRLALVEELEVRYQLERREAELDLLRLGADLQSTQLRLRNILVLALTSVLLVALLATFGALRNTRVQAGLKQDLAERNEALEQAVQRISELARRDPLTGLLNRRALEELAAREIIRQRREREPLSVILADIDHFKPINDQHGHAVGDEVLEAIAERLKKTFRECDLIARWGGEEFLCILPNTTPEAAAAAIKRLQQDLHLQPVQTRVGALPITLTFGVAKLDGDLGESIRQADFAMYEGKAAGRNQTVMASRRRTRET